MGKGTMIQGDFDVDFVIYTTSKSQLPIRLAMYLLATFSQALICIVQHG